MPLFSKKKPAPTPRESIAKLQETITLLEKREGFLQKKVAQQTDDAKKFVAAKNKKSALMCLKRKKMYEVQMDKLSSARMTLEGQIMALEEAAITAETFGALRTGHQALTAYTSQLNIDEVEETMDEIAYQMETSNAITDAISQPLTTFDDDELLQELDKLTEEVLEEEMSGLQRARVSQTNPPKQELSEEAELEAMEASMMMAV